MFRDCIRTSPFVSQMANSYFKNVKGESFSGDISFISTLRALLNGRLKDDEEVYLEFCSSSLRKRDIERNTASAVMNNLYQAHIRAGNIYIHNISYSDQIDGEACMKFINDHFVEAYDGFSKLEKMTDFFKKTFNVICYINPATKNVAIWCENLDMRKMHYLQCSIFAFMPWYFDPQVGVTQLEMNLIKSLRERTKDLYVGYLQDAIKNVDLRTGYIKDKLKGFEAQFAQRELSREESRYNDIMNSIRRKNEDIQELLRRKKEKDIRILGLKDLIEQNEESSELMEYFLCNKNLVLEEVGDGYITFVAKGNVTYFDEDMAATMINNHRGYIFRHRRNPSDEDWEILMRALFIDQTLMLRFCAAYQITIGERVQGISGYDYRSAEYNTYTPNPHIHHYSCLGDHQYAINECIQRGDYIGAISQCMASVMSLNFGDSIVMEKFMNNLSSDGYDYLRCIQLPDESVVTPIEAIGYLKSVEEEKRLKALEEAMAAEEATKVEVEIEAISEVGHETTDIEQQIDEDMLDEEDDFAEDDEDIDE